MAPFGILFAIVCIIPIFYAIYSSFFRQVTEGGGAYGGGELVNKFVGFQNFEYVLTSGNFWSGVGRVLIYTLIQVPLMIIIALAWRWSSIRSWSSTSRVSVSLLPAVRHSRCGRIHHLGVPV